MAKVCPECGSTVFVKSGYAIKERQRIQRYRCNKCLRTFTKPKWTRGKSKQVLNNTTEVLDTEDKEMI